jgi:hypothetical protein
MCGWMRNGIFALDVKEILVHGRDIWPSLRAGHKVLAGAPARQMGTHRHIGGSGSLFLSTLEGA